MPSRDGRTVDLPKSARTIVAAVEPPDAPYVRDLEPLGWSVQFKPTLPELMSCLSDSIAGVILLPALLADHHRCVETLGQLHAFFGSEPRPLIVATGSADESDILASALKGGADFAVIVPVNAAFLAAQLDHAIAVRNRLENWRRQRDEANRRAAQCHVWREREVEKVASDSRSKSEFLASVSHEIRTAMTAILGFADLIWDNVENEESQSAVQIVKRNGKYLLDLIDDILDFSKIEAGRLQIETVACTARDIVSEVADLMRVKADEKFVDLVVEYHGPVATRIVTDPVRLRQILLNLVSNAVKFTEAGVVRIITQLNRRDSTSGQLELRIADTGIGLTEEQVGRIFRPFIQASQSTSRKFGGTGLGLAISRQLTHLLGGDISVTSQSGQGIEFHVSIPVEMSAEQAEESRPEPPAAAAAPQPPALIEGCRILLAEDGPDNQRLIQFLLRKAGAEVIVAENGKQAVKHALEALHSESPFDIILMDMQMPVMDGYEATRTLRQSGYRRPIIALTAHALAVDRQKCLEAGCDEYTTKPIDRANLLAQVARFAAPLAAQT